MKNRDAETERRVEGFIAKFEARHQTVIRAVRKSLRGRFPAANEIVYDNYNFFVIGYGHTDRPTDCFVSIAAAANGVGLCFLQGAKLPDPHKVLLGSGKQTRFIRLPSADMLERPEIATLLSVAAAERKGPPLEAGPGQLIIQSVSKKQRPRRAIKKGE
ncbi:MAG: hypothetical protein ACLQVY_06110 [Limisphaerales bacterium]